MRGESEPPTAKGEFEHRAEAETQSPTRIVDDLASSVQAQTVEYQTGQSIGRYVVLDRLGAGGMSVVYGAYDPDLDRKIAIKVLLMDPHDDPSASASRAREARLLREAQALAKLSHPNVLPVFDVGTTDGHVFIAMEYVDGCTLAEWSQKPRPWGEVLDHYVKAGRGLAAAHAAGLVHRDFKPHNVMVGKDGSVRVMDFGLVRLNEGEGETERSSSGALATENTAQSFLSHELTVAGAVLGTWAYMAPEQHLGEPVDPRADQYSFCVALYQGLYGVRPFATTAPKPLLAAKQHMQFQPVPAHRGQSVPTRLNRALIRGLDPDPSQRWPSMEVLLQVLQRDRAQTWGRAAASLTVAGLLRAGGMAYVGHGQTPDQICSGGAEEFARIWNEDKKGRIQAAFEATRLPYAKDAWVTVDQTLDEYRDGWTTMHRESCEATQVRRVQSTALMDLRMTCLETRLWRAAALVKVFEEADPKAVENAAEAVRSLPSIAGCGDLPALQSSEALPDDPKVRKRIAQLRKRLAEPRALTDAGLHPQGLAKVIPLVEEARSMEYVPVLAEALQLQGMLEYNVGDFSAAEATLIDAAWRADSVGAAEVGADVKAQLLLIVGYHLARPAEAMVWAQAAKGSVARLEGNPGLEAQYLNALAVVQSSQNRHEQAHLLFSRALELQQEAHGSEHPVLVRSYGNFAIVLMLRGRVDEALPYATRAIELGERILGKQHTEIAFPLLTRAALRVRQGYYQEALADDQRAKAILVASLGEPNPYTTTVDRSLAHVLVHMGRFEKARTLLERLLAGDRVPGKEDRPAVASDLAILGRLQEAQGRPDQAVESYQEAVRILSSIPGGNMELPKVHAGLGRALADVGRFSEALEPLEQALANQDEDRTNGEVALTQFALARALEQTGGDQTRARRLASDALARLQGDVREPMYLPWRDTIRGWLASFDP